ncbi:hypothetical protein HNY73_008896 [Argiope bruennichi]|uniref:Gustatory receptor n=1 Tax=Argiope bruennichi TaxID=94029 RepID=A0A8T0F8S9_ARGBR|nr:hypothetical protein HNY73_008896 [Argiope bruennichi]
MATRKWQWNGYKKMAYFLLNSVRKIKEINVEKFPETNSDTYRTNRCILRFLLLILSYTGLVKNSGIHCGWKPIVFVIILLFVNVDNWILLILQYNETFVLRTIIAYIITYLLAACAWYSIYLKRKQLADLLTKLQEMSFSTEGKKVIFLVLIVCCTPIATSATATIFVIETNSTYFSYGYKIENPFEEIFLVCFKNVFNTIVFPTFTNIIAIFYCLICFRLQSEIKHVTLEIQKCHYGNFSESKRNEILRWKSRINDALHCTEEVFSQASFIIIVANLLTCFSMLSTYLDNNIWRREYLSLYAEWILYSINCLGSVIFILWIAGGIPVVESAFKEAFHEKMCFRMLLTGSSENLKLEKWFFSNQEVVLSGAGILSYRRSSIFAVFGTLVTYTVLVVNN